VQIENCELQIENWFRGAIVTSEELIERLINFAARVGKVVDALPDTRMGRHIGGQLVRSGTSPAPNYEEACAAESRADLVHKLSINLKELRESRCWIRLIIKTEMLPEHRMGEYSMNAISCAT
jgi:four helix bundle protein